MTNSRRVLLIPILIMAVFAAGCQANRKKVIGVVPKATSHLFWQTVQAGCVAAGQEFDVEIGWNGPALETDYSRQIQIVDSLIARHVDGIVMAATDKTALVGPLERAAKAGIPVTVFDSGIDSEQYVTFVATNNYEAGKLAAREFARILGGKGKAAVLMNLPGSASTMERERGFDEAMAAEFPGITLVARQFGQSDRAKARAAAENMLAAHADLAGMFASSEPSIAGAALAVKARELSGKVHLVGFDASEGIVADMRDGAIDALVVQDPFRMGHDAVQSVVDHLAGRRVPKKMDLAARVVTRGDLEKPDVKALLFPDLKKYLQ